MPWRGLATSITSFRGVPSVRLNVAWSLDRRFPAAALFPSEASRRIDHAERRRKKAAIQHGGVFFIRRDGQRHAQSSQGDLLGGGRELPSARRHRGAAGLQADGLRLDLLLIPIDLRESLGQKQRSQPDDGSRTPADPHTRLTLNRKHFLRIHAGGTKHAGMILCTFDPDFEGQAERIHQAVGPYSDVEDTVIRVNRPAASTEVKFDLGPKPNR